MSIMIMNHIGGVEELYQAILRIESQWRPELLCNSKELRQWVEKLYKNSIVLTAKEEGKIVGILAVYANDYVSLSAYITSIMVEETHRGMGIGSNLLLLCEKKVKTNGMKWIQLEVRENNNIARSFYVKHGYIENGISRPGRLYMKKML